MEIEQISLRSARRIALAAQGFGAKRPAATGKAQLLRTLDRLHLHQIDSVNVLARAHYLPAFSRLGPYDRADLDRLAWGPKRQRRLFEYWAHEASLLPLDLHPLLRWRMAQADRGDAGWGRMRVYATERRAEAMALLDRIRIEGPLAASDFESHKGQSGWWEWSDTKRALEWLFWAGHITTATRRGSFERVYDLTGRVIPPEVLACPTPTDADAHRVLIELAASALGIATSGELRDYFRQSPDEARPAIQSLAEEGVLVPVEVPGWQHTWLHRDARRPRRIDARGEAAAWLLRAALPVWRSARCPGRSQGRPASPPADRAVGAFRTRRPGRHATGAPVRTGEHGEVAWSRSVASVTALPRNQHQKLSIPEPQGDGSWPMTRTSAAEATATA
jgi:uncharacterized protein